MPAFPEDLTIPGVTKGGSAKLELGQTVIIVLLGPKSPLLVRTSVPKPNPKRPILQMWSWLDLNSNHAKTTFQRQKCIY